MKRCYDIIIPLGATCQCAQLLKDMSLRRWAFPFDWSGGRLWDICGCCALPMKINLIRNDFEGFFLYNDFQNNGKQIKNPNYLDVFNKRTGLQYLHDFSSALSFDEQFDCIALKYQRRVRRLYEVINQSSRILFVFITKGGQVTNELMLHSEYVIKQKFKKNIDYLFILHNSNFSKDEKKEYDLNDNIHIIECNTVESNTNDWMGNQCFLKKLLSEYSIELIK